MNDDEDILNTNRPEPDEHSIGKYLPKAGIAGDLNKNEPGIKRSLIYTKSTKIKDLPDRISYLKRELTKYRQGIHNSFEFYDEYDFDKCISLEIENLLEEYKHSHKNGQYVKVTHDYDPTLMAAIFSLCTEYEVFNYSFPDFIKYIETAHFEIEASVLPHRSFRYLIYFLQTPLGKTWYHSVVEHSGIPVTRFGGLRNATSIRDFVNKLDKVYADYKKRH
jgi:hypothetical protein